MATITLDEYIQKYTDQIVSSPNVPAGSCMAILHTYCQEVLGIEDLAVLANPIASEVFTNYANEVGHEKFSKIDNTPDFVPQKGDIAVFGANAEAGIPNGHVCIFVEGDVNNFKSFDQNFPTGSVAHIQEHSYNDFLGVLRFIPEPAPEISTEQPATPETNSNEYKGLDLTNQESVKAAVDAWHDVAFGKYVNAEEHQAAMNALAEKLGVAPELDVMKAKIEELQNKPPEVQTQEVVKEVPVDPALDPAKVESHPVLKSLYDELLKFLKLSPPETSTPDAPQG